MYSLLLFNSNPALYESKVISSLHLDLEADRHLVKPWERGLREPGVHLPLITER